MTHEKGCSSIHSPLVPLSTLVWVFLCSCLIHCFLVRIFISRLYMILIAWFLLLCNEGEGRVGGDETEKKREGSHLINLELEVGGFGGQSCVIKQEEENILFTAAQIHELYLQVVVFKYLSSGLPVPFHLVLPIWKSVVSSLGRGFSPQEFVNGSMMDPEPGRCRRTDGKKWRCHSSVVPDQKYCARHMHRGSQRSRKLVEASKDIVKSNTEALTSGKSKSPIISSRAAVTNGRISVPISTSLDLAITSATVEVGSTSISYNSNSEGSSTNIVQIDGGAATSSLLIAQAGKNNTRNESNWHDSPALGFNHFSTSKTYQWNQGNKSSAKPSIAAGFGVSPKSVLQSGIGTGCSNLSLDKIGMETEALRCRRTDGKRWRCSRDVVPYKKYCANHMYRGAKKATVDSKSVTGAPGASAARIAGAYGMPEKIKNCRNLNTNLSMSIAASPQPMLDSDSNSSSDATTVSDENARVSHILTLSP